MHDANNNNDIAQLDCYGMDNIFLPFVSLAMEHNTQYNVLKLPWLPPPPPVLWCSGTVSLGVFSLEVSGLNPC